MAKRENISRIAAKFNHVFFTPDSASDFRQANLGEGIHVGKVTFLREMSMDFFTMKSEEFTTFMSFPNDDEMMRRIMREIPGFAK